MEIACTRMMEQLTALDPRTNPHDGPELMNNLVRRLFPRRKASGDDIEDTLVACMRTREDSYPCQCALMYFGHCRGYFQDQTVDLLLEIAKQPEFEGERDLALATLLGFNYLNLARRSLERVKSLCLDVLEGAGWPKRAVAFAESIRPDLEMRHSIEQAILSGKIVVEHGLVDRLISESRQQEAFSALGYDELPEALRSVLAYSSVSIGMNGVAQIAVEGLSGIGAVLEVTWEERADVAIVRAARVLKLLRC